MVRDKTKLTKKEIAQKLGVSIASLYYQPKRPAIDLEVKNQIESVLTTHRDYGHKRIALTLKLNKKRILRVMKKFGIKPYRRRTKIPIKKNDLNKPANTRFTNLLKSFPITDINQVWVSDFTYLRYQNRFIYLATTMDVCTREIVGINISRFHNKDLVLGALRDALDHHPPPLMIHSDQGSEYLSADYINFVEKSDIKVSISDKSSPWQNGYQESFYSQFKPLLGDTNRFKSMGELIEEIYQQVYYYNYQRIHSKLKTSPVNFRKQMQKLFRKEGA